MGRKVTEIPYTTDVVKVNGENVKVPFGYEKFVRDQSFDALRFSKQKRKEWAVQHTNFLDEFNNLVKFTATLNQLELNRTVREFTTRHNALVTIINERTQRLREKTGSIKELPVADMLPATKDAIEEKRQLIQLEKVAQSLKKKIDDLKANAQNPEQQQRIFSGDGRKVSRDDPYQDPHVLTYQIADEYSHPYYQFKDCSHLAIEYAIDNVYPAFDALIDYERAFIAYHQPNFFSRVLDFITFGWWNKEEREFNEKLGDLVDQKELQVQRAKQSLAQAAYDRLTTSLISPDLNVARFEKFAGILQEHGNFTVVNVAHENLDHLLSHIATLQQENKKPGFFKSLVNPEAKNAYEQKEKYLKQLKLHVESYRYDVDALVKESGKAQFILLLAEFNQTIRKGKYPINASHLEASPSVLIEFINFLEKKKIELEKSDPGKGFILFRLFVTPEEIRQYTEKLSYLRTLVGSVKTKVATPIKLVIEGDNPLAKEFLTSYNEKLEADKQPTLIPSGLQQLISEIITWKEGDAPVPGIDAVYLARDVTEDRFKHLLEAYNIFAKTSITLDPSKPDNVARLDALKAIQQRKDFDQFVKWYHDNSLIIENYLTSRSPKSFDVYQADYKSVMKEDYRDRTRYFESYLKQFQRELADPYRSLSSKYNDRLQDAIANLVDIIIHHGVNDHLIKTTSNYINLIRYLVSNSNSPTDNKKLFENEPFKSIKMNHPDLNDEQIKNNYLNVLNLVQKIISGELVSLNDEHKALINEYLIPRDELNKTNEANTLGLLVVKYTRHHLRHVLNQENATKEQRDRARDYLKFIDENNENLNIDEQYKGIAFDAVGYFNELLQRDIGKELPLPNKEGFIQVDSDNLESRIKLKPGVSSSTTSKFAEKVTRDTTVLDHGTQDGVFLPFTIQGVWQNEARISLYANFNDKKSVAVDEYLEKYESTTDREYTAKAEKFTAYAELITIIGTEEQIRRYGKKLLELSFDSKNNDITLNEAQKDFIRKNDKTLSDIKESVINDYIQAVKVCTPITLATIDEFGTESNQVEYAHKYLIQIFKPENTEIHPLGEQLVTSFNREIPALVAAKEKVINDYIEKVKCNDVTLSTIDSIGTDNNKYNYGHKYLKQIFDKGTVHIELTAKQKESFGRNRVILEAVREQVIGDYISQVSAWSAKTQEAIDFIGTKKNQQDYVNKRLVELLKSASGQAERFGLLYAATPYINYLDEKIRGGFSLNKVALKQLFINFLNQNTTADLWNETSEELVKRYLDNNPVIISRLRLNQLKHLLVSHPEMDETKLLAETEKFLDFMTKNPCEFTSPINQLRIKEIFSIYLEKASKWSKHAELLALKFDPTGELGFLDQIRLLRVRELITENKTPKTEQYIKDVNQSFCPLFPVSEKAKDDFDLLIKSELIKYPEKQGADKYNWHENTEIIVKHWGNDAQKEICNIAWIASLFKHDDILLIEQLIENRNIAAISNKLVSSEDGKKEIRTLLKYYTDKSWNPKIELLIEKFEPSDDKHKLLQNTA